ncbi:MAG: hypothetical protein CSB06_02385 [Bacteroidia bacterium]|nr:MAG: hypothetical protein CSB06_02385 [Bacteroidia bacterium]
MKNIPFALILSTLLFLFSCTKEKEEIPPAPADPNDHIGGRTIRYTVLAVPAGNTGFHSKTIPGLDSCKVSLVMNDSIYTVATDHNGLATFNNLAAGIAAVSVKYPKHTSVNYLVDISAVIDSNSSFDAENLRNASTMVALFPLEGEGTATISGKLFADLDATNPGLETVTKGVQINAQIDPKQLKKYVNHSGAGKILNISYEQAIQSSVSGAGGNYSLTVPASGSGVEILLSADEFEEEQTTSSGKVRTIFRPDTVLVKTLSGSRYIRDITFR